jgi:hypothetical protein
MSDPPQAGRNLRRSTRGHDLPRVWRLAALAEHGRELALCQVQPANQGPILDEASRAGQKTAP